MSDWIGLGIFLLVIAGAVVGLSFLGKKRPPMTNEEFEARAAEARGTMSGVAGAMYALQKLMNPKAAEAVEVQKDLRAGFYDDKEHAGEGDGEEDEHEPRGAAGEPGLKQEGRQRTAEDETDA